MSYPSISADDFVQRSFDYIIVGGGTAGLTVAARLSEDPAITVGVLEAGSATFDSLEINVPGRYGESLGSLQDWQYETTAQPGLGGRKLPWPRGKVLGGSSALNFMTWNRPNKEDLDAWEELGNRGWGWKDIEPYFKKSERFVAPPESSLEEHKISYDRDAFGLEGPLPITYLTEYSASHQYWHDTLHQLGVQTNHAHLSGSNVGVWTNVVAVDPQTVTRSYAATAYFLPNANRKNLVVLIGATAREIIIEQHDGERIAKGVRFDHGGSQFTVRVSHEVVISAGAVASPQLLELSGIGNPSILNRAGIETKVANSNVGENLQDHMMTASVFEIDPTIQTPEDLRNDPVLRANADELYEKTRGGPRAILPCSICYLPLGHFVPPATLESQAARASLSSAREKILARRLSLNQRLGYIEYIFDVGNWSPFYQPSGPGKKYATLLQILQYPFSRGSIHISAQAPYGNPDIDPQYYGGDQGSLDLEIQEDCATFGLQIAETQPLKDIIVRRVWPPIEVTEPGAMKEWLVDNTITDWHPVGTCGMGGDRGIDGGVVDERLRVYGVKGLRVVDASVMPLQISAHLQATVYAIAEKASDMIVEDRKASIK